VRFAFSTAALILATCLATGGAWADDLAPPVATASLDELASADGAEAPSVGVDGEFRCPGDDPGFWMDYRETGWVGFGETWDLDSCSQGLSVYAKGANRRWPDMRPKLANAGARKLKPMMSEAEIHYYTSVLPYMAGGVLGLAFLLAWAMTFLDRFKKRTVRLVACESCGTTTPIEKVEGGVFCPSCGAGVPWAEDARDPAATEP
jgi:predicted RNA-binding Zn-ribbon protein involved in translation (DUF1610 family)